MIPRANLGISPVSPLDPHLWLRSLSSSYYGYISFRPIGAKQGPEASKGSPSEPNKEIRLTHLDSHTSMGFPGVWRSCRWY